VLFDPELFVLGGGVAKSGRALFDAARKEMALRRYGSAVSTPRLVPAELEETAGAVGAALLARDEPPA
jgi:predicted NBD/HSP70 family sugar kinase